MQLIDKYINHIILWAYTDLSKAPDKTCLSNSSISYQNYFEQVVIIFHAHPKLWKMKQEDALTLIKSTNMLLLAYDAVLQEPEFTW